MLLSLIVAAVAAAGCGTDLATSRPLPTSGASKFHPGTYIGELTCTSSSTLSPDPEARSVGSDVLRIGQYGQPIDPQTGNDLTAGDQRDVNLGELSMTAEILSIATSSDTIIVQEVLVFTMEGRGFHTAANHTYRFVDANTVVYTSNALTPIRGEIFAYDCEAVLTR